MSTPITQIDYTLTPDDHKWIQRAFFIKQLQYPQRIRQSNFNVLCILTYSIPPQPADTQYMLPIQRYGQSIQRGVEYIVGCNVETCFIGNGLCAERSALVQLAQLQYKRIHALYLVSDKMDDVLTPGLLCREFLSEYIDGSTPIIMASYDTRHPSPAKSPPSSTTPDRSSDTPSIPELREQKLVTRVTNIDLLFPHKSLYIGVNRPDILPHLQHFHSRAEQLTTTHLSTADSIKAVMHGELSKPQRDLHPTRLAAGVYEINPASKQLTSPLPHHVYHQHQLREYNYTLDPVMMLLNDMQCTFAGKVHSLTQYVLIISDQYGNLHPPVAAARAHLFESGFGQLNIWIHDHSGKLVNCTINDLVPDYVNLEDALKKIDARAD